MDLKCYQLVTGKSLVITMNVEYTYFLHLCLVKGIYMVFKLFHTKIIIAQGFISGAAISLLLFLNRFHCTAEYICSHNAFVFSCSILNINNVFVIFFQFIYLCHLHFSFSSSYRSHFPASQLCV